MKCSFCEGDLLPKKENFLCPNCSSYYRFLEEDEKKMIYWAYPDKSLRIKFEMQTIYVQK
jgi:hypothetical protein